MKKCPCCAEEIQGGARNRIALTVVVLLLATGALAAPQLFPPTPFNHDPPPPAGFDESTIVTPRLQFTETFPNGLPDCVVELGGTIMVSDFDNRPCYCLCSNFGNCTWLSLLEGEQICFEAP